MLKLSILGQDSLAEVTRNCCARFFDLTPRPVQETDIVWFCEDTPIENDQPRDDVVIGAIARVAHALAAHETKPLLLISSQLPVGTTAALEAEFPSVSFAHSPENIRVAHGVADFEDQARIVVGRRTPNHDDKLRELLSPFTNNLIFTDTETAECCKHALNTWLALNIVFANEIARFCGSVGADANTVSKALLAERRVSPHAPLRPGAPYGGGHLARDIYTVNRIARSKGIALPVISRIRESNES